MNHLGLFEGIGGFSLAASWMGWETVAWCEINPFCQQVLKYHFPEAEGHSDITKTDWIKNSLESAGNAIVPQVALQLFKAIEQMENPTP